ncbi:MAG: HNH endonuclease signature motif containing protein [Acidimicrobiales bacterium]
MVQAATTEFPDEPVPYPKWPAQSGSADPDLPGPDPLLDDLDRAFDLVSNFVGHVDPDTVTGEQAEQALDRFLKIERSVAAGKLGFARRAARCSAWHREGHPSAGHWLANRAKTTVGDAVGVLKTADQLPKLEATRDALRTGAISLAQAREIADASSVDPGAEGHLIEAAGYLTLRGLQHRAHIFKQAAVDERKQNAEILRRRALRHWTDSDGAFHLHAVLTPDDGVSVISAIKSRKEYVVDEARQAGVESEDSQAAYDADALVALVLGDWRRATFQGNIGGKVRPSTVVFHVSLEALRRGAVEPGDVCEIAGVGPVPLAVAEHIIGDSLLKLVITDGVDVTTACGLGRTIPAAVETALEARDRTCVVPDCDVSVGLEIDHWQIPFAQGGPSALHNLARLCRFHHQRKTYDGFVLSGGPGAWEWTAPGQPTGRGSP